MYDRLQNTAKECIRKGISTTLTNAKQIAAKCVTSLLRPSMEKDNAVSMHLTTLYIRQNPLVFEEVLFKNVHDT